jgi:hypothetical protein
MNKRHRYYQPIPNGTTYEQLGALARCTALLLPSVVNNPDAFTIQYTPQDIDSTGYWASFDTPPPANVKERVENLARTLVFGVTNMMPPKD